MKSWNTKNNAVLKTALFFEITQLHIDSLEKRIFHNRILFSNTDKIYSAFFNYINSLINEFFTPFIVKEINEQRETLSGKTPKERYASFFLTKDITWKLSALDIGTKYKEQLLAIQQLIQTEIQALHLFLQRLKSDFAEINQTFKMTNTCIHDIEIASSDRHNFNGPIIFITFSNKQKIVYKTKSAMSDNVLKKIMKLLGFDSYLSSPLNIDKLQYNWSEFVKYTTYKSNIALKQLYKNFGLQLALFDILNYSDGHAENFIVSKKEFIPIDTETMFTNLSYFKGRAENYFDLSFTGMIRPKNKKMPYQALLRKEKKMSFFPYKPYICDDNTDLISMNYQQVIKNPAENSFPAKHKIALKKYSSDMLEGLNIGYNLIKEHQKELINFLRDSHILTRQIVRPTLYYTWIIYRYLHPDNHKYQKFLYENLHNLSDNLFNYEQKYIKFGNIPVYYQKLHSRHLYGHNNVIIEKNYFSNTAYFWIKEKIAHLNNHTFIEQRKQELQKALR